MRPLETKKIMNHPPIRIYNTLSRKKEAFLPRLNREVSFYSCGPTVYNYPHLGNLRTFLTVDFWVRFLEFVGWKVKLVNNITDIDDKIIVASAKAGQSVKEYTGVYTKAFFANLNALKIRPADVYPKATEHFAEIKKLVKTLEQKGFAYQTEDGIYFNIGKLASYGRLSGLAQQKLKAGARILADSYDKETPADFALWKTKENRPGWHIECSAMAAKYLDLPIDIHFGGQDLIFPHHENERAQTLAATGKELSRFWLHAGYLLVDGKKMSKSLGNYYILSDIVKKGFSPLDFRYLCLTAGWREPLNFTWQALAAAAAARQKIIHLRGGQPAPSEVEGMDSSEVENGRRQIIAALSDNLNTASAIGLLHEAAEPQLWREFDSIFQLGLEEGSRPKKIPTEITALAKKRDDLRQKGDFAAADKIREEIISQGYPVEDSKI